MNANKTFYFIFLVVSLLCSALSSLASNSPITIEADHMESLEAENTVLFTGNVDARQADVRIQADKMTVFYTTAGKGKKQEVKRIRCEGNVEITKGEWLGTGKTMNYLAKDRKVILSGNAKAWQDTNLITGNTIVYHLDEGRSEVIGETTSTTAKGEKGGKKPGRVKATLTPQ